MLIIIAQLGTHPFPYLVATIVNIQPRLATFIVNSLIRKVILIWLFGIFHGKFKVAIKLVIHSPALLTFGNGQHDNDGERQGFFCHANEATESDRRHNEESTFLEVPDVHL